MFLGLFLAPTTHCSKRGRSVVAGFPHGAYCGCGSRKKGTHALKAAAPEMAKAGVTHSQKRPKATPRVSNFPRF
jgi:hypothetical protein